MTDSQGYIEVDLFPEEVDSADHPEVIHFKGILEDVAEDFNCRLVSFEIRQGTVTFSFDSEELMAEILQILKHDSQSQS